MAQSVKHLTSAQVMMLRSGSSSLSLGSVLTAQSLEPISDSVSACLSAPPLLMRAVCTEPDVGLKLTDSEIVT